MFVLFDSLFKSKLESFTFDLFKYRLKNSIGIYERPSGCCRWLHGKHECKQKLSESQHQFAESNYPNAAAVTRLTGSGAKSSKALNDSSPQPMKQIVDFLSHDKIIAMMTLSFRPTKRVFLSWRTHYFLATILQTNNN